MIDEAPASGVLGATGRGTDEHYGVAATDVDIWSGSLAKAIPANGGFFAVSHEIGIYLQHVAAPFIFSPPLFPSAGAPPFPSPQIFQNQPPRPRPLPPEAELPPPRPPGLW